MAMKHFFSYSLLVVTLMLGVATFGAKLWEKCTVTCQAVNLSIDDETSSVPRATDCFLHRSDAAGIPAGLNRLPQFRVYSNAERTGHNEFHQLRIVCRTQSVAQQLHITLSAYRCLFAEREKTGYYIYTLRKLLI